MKCQGKNLHWLHFLCRSILSAQSSYLLYLQSSCSEVFMTLKYIINVITNSYFLSAFAWTCSRNTNVHALLFILQLGVHTQACSTHAHYKPGLQFHGDIRKRTYFFFFFLSKQQQHGKMEKNTMCSCFMRTVSRTLMYCPCGQFEWTFIESLLWCSQTWELTIWLWKRSQTR